VAACDAYNLMGNRRTPQRKFISTTIGGADKNGIFGLVIQHEVRLLSYGIFKQAKCITSE